MSNFDTPWFIEGALHSAQVARNIAYTATAGKQGPVMADDCQVLELATPGGSVRVTPGTIVALAQGLADESYVARLPVEDTVAITATDSTGGRSDLVVALVHNPAYDASAPAGWPTIDPEAGPFAQTYVYEGVPAGTTDVQDVDPGVSAVTLARIDLPASTATVTQGMIVDLRPTSVAPMSEAEADSRYVNADGDTVTGDLLLPSGNEVGFKHPSRSEKHYMFVDDRGYLNFYLDTNDDGTPEVACLQILDDGRVTLAGPQPSGGNDVVTKNYVDSATAKVATGWYNGAGIDGWGVAVGFAPKFVLVVSKSSDDTLTWMSTGYQFTPGNFGVLANTTSGTLYGLNDVTIYGLTETGFAQDSDETGASGVTYHYLAIG